MRLYFYRGKGLGAALIRWFSRSKYAHVSIVFQDGAVFEAYPRVGVRKTWLKSTKGITPFVFKLGAPVDSAAVRIFLDAECGAGTKYDYWGVICFVMGLKPRRSEARYFCSELVFDALRAGGVDLLDRVDGWKLRPDELSWSPLITIDSALKFQWENPI